MKLQWFCRWGTLVLLAGWLGWPARGEVNPLKQETVAYAGWPHCIKLSNGSIELIATTDVGPRIMRFGFVGGANVLGENAPDLGKTGGREWRSYGGHRLWNAPEHALLTYALDNAPVQHTWANGVLTLTQATEPETGIQKQITVRMEPESDRVTLTHRLLNTTSGALQLSPWCLTVMTTGGTAIIPQEDFRPHPDNLQPARPMVLWHYTNMADPRWTWGRKYIQLRQDNAVPGKQKVGLFNHQGWMAYALADQVFVKSYPADAHSTYPDYGCNTETFTNVGMLELETLGPLVTAMPGESVEHVETWQLFKAKPELNDAGIDGTVLPLVKSMR
jgi:hypothetical protein